MTEKFANDAQTTLDGAIDDSVTTLNVVDASAFPTEGDFRIRVEDEYMLVTGVNAEEFTVERAAEGSVVAAHADTSTVTHVLTAGGLEAKTAGLSEPLIVYDRYGHPIVQVEDDDFGSGDPDNVRRKVTVYMLTPWDSEDPEGGNIPALEYEQQSVNSGAGQTYSILRNDGNTAITYAVETGGVTFPDSVGTPAVVIEPSGHVFAVNRDDGGACAQIDGTEELLSLVGSMDLTELPTAPDAPDVGVPKAARLYTEDLGGKTALYVRFATGTPVKLAEEP